MNLTQRRLKACPNAQALATELVGACNRFGAIQYLKVLVASYHGQLQALCFWKMADGAAEQQVMAMLHVHRVSDYLVLVVAMPPGQPGQPAMYPMATAQTRG